MNIQKVEFFSLFREVSDENLIVTSLEKTGKMNLILFYIISKIPR